MKLRRVNIRGVFSVWLRHAAVYRKTWLINCVPPLSEPVVYLVSFGYGFSPFMAALTYLGKPVSYIEFIAPGMMAVGMLFQAYMEGAYGTFVRIRYRKFWQSAMTSPLGYDELFLGDLLWAATKGMFAATATALVAILWGAYSPVHYFLSIPIIVLGSVLFASLGLLTTGLARTIDEINIPIFLFVTPMFVLSGTYFPREVLPDWLRLFADVLPLSGLVDLLRWNLGLRSGWPIALAALLFWTCLSAWLAHRSIYRRLFP